MPDENKLFVLAFTNKYREKKTFTSSVAAQQVPDNVLILYSNETTFGKAGAIS